jgi:competence protein ComGC
VGAVSGQQPKISCAHLLVLFVVGLVGLGLCGLWNPGKRDRVRCLDRLYRVCDALEVYEMEKGEFPSSLDRLVAVGLLSRQEIGCPLTDRSGSKAAPYDYTQAANGGDAIVECRRHEGHMLKRIVQPCWVRCRSRLKSVEEALRAYQDEHEEMPESLGQLVDVGLLRPEEIRCPPTDGASGEPALYAFTRRDESRMAVVECRRHEGHALRRGVPIRAPRERVHDGARQR